MEVLTVSFIGKRVKHSKFGEGTITQQDAACITVRFIANPVPKKFIYPSCFKTFLTLLDASAATEAKTALAQHEAQEQAKKQQAAYAAQAHYRAKKLQRDHSGADRSVEIHPFSSVAEFCSTYKSDLGAEIAYLKATGGKRQRVFDGKCIEEKNGHYVYVFDTDDELNYPEGTQISIWTGPLSIPGHAVYCEDFTIVLTTGKNLGKDVPSLEFSAEPWRLLNTLIERLDSIQERPSEIVRALVCDGQKSIEYNRHSMITGPEMAVQMSQEQPITFVWGPPGTGKTQTLAKIALAHIAQGKRVLMVSYSNVSVDGAIMRVHEQSPHQEPGTLVRYGYARRKDLLEHEYLTSYNLVIRNHPELLKERRDLIAERKKLSKNSPRYLEIGRRLSQIKNTLQHEEKEAVRAAKFVATTVSKAIIDSTVRDTRFDLVIFDEASMAYIPQIVFAAGLAKQHFVCMGDFKQLPPIVQSSATSPLNADIFQYCGISSAVDNGWNHKWLCMLDTQYRMQPDIAEFASQTMYRGLLHSAPDMAQKRQDIVKLGPIAGATMAFADLSGMMSVCTKTGNGSRTNVLSALLSFSLALEAAEHCEIGMITPYHAQARLLHAMARDAASTNPKLKPISCATVHQFQGSEKDMILYDAVDCYRMPYPGLLLTSTGNDYANRLYNVALTRARGKFIGVANIAYMDNKNLSGNLMFARMIESQRGKPSCLSGQVLLQACAASSDRMMRFFDSCNGSREFLRDIACAKQEIRIDIPNKPVENAFSEQLAAALQTAKRNGVKVSLRAEKKCDLPSGFKALAIENSFVANPVAILDKKIVWFGMPDSGAEFRSEGKTLRTKYRPIIRLEGTRTAKSLYGFLEMSRTTDQCTTIGADANEETNADTFASYVRASKKCPSCGRPMKLIKSKRGKFFLACAGYPACRKTLPVDIDMIEEYFYRNSKKGQHCVQCGYSLEAKAGKYGVYVQCCGAQRHKYKLDEI